MKTRRFGAAALAAVTALSLNTGVANAATPAEEYKDFKDVINGLELLAEFGKYGIGVMPKTETAGKMVAGSVDAGSSGSQAYWATQVGWGAVWAGLIGTVATVGYNEAVKAGLVQPMM